MECVVIVVAIIALFVGGVVYFYRAMNQAQALYLSSLEALKRDPHNPNLREQTLAYGRRYGQLVKNTVNAFDEVALLNDINAACARAGSKVKVQHEPKSDRVEERLQNLERLRNKGLITDGEYDERRNAILEDL